MVNLDSLFDNSNGNERNSSKSTNQQRFEDRIETHVSPLVDVVHDAFDSMRDAVNSMPASFRNRNTKSQRMNEQLKGLLTDVYGSRIVSLPYGRFGLSIEGYMLLFKKLDGRLRPSNIPTGNSRNIARQGRLNFPGEPEVIFVGYTVSPGYGEVNSIMAVKIEDNEIQWSVDLQSLRGDIGRRGQNVNTPVQGGPVVTPKNKVDKKTG